MPSTQRTASVGVVVAALVLAYALLVAGQILLGVLVAGAVYGTALLVSVASRDGVVAEMGRLRAAVTGVLVVGIVAYGIVIVGQILLSLFLAALVFLLSWLTAPDGPLVRLVRWVLAARDDLRTIRDRLTDDSGAAADD